MSSTKSYLNYFQNLPKGDLHLHLSGCLSINDVELIYNKFDYDLSRVAKISKFFNYRNPEVWAVLSKIMTSPSSIEYSLELALHKLMRDNVKRCELTFNIGSIISGQLNLEKTLDSMDSVLSREGFKERIDCKIRLGVNRRNGPCAVHIASEMYHKSNSRILAGLDINGDEKRFPTSLFIDSLMKAKSLDVPFKIHAGEYLDCLDSMKDAVSLEPQRIGHGIAAVQDPEFIKLLEKKQIGLEICPTSNIKTGSVSNYKNHPIFRLIKTDIPLVLCTDNPGLFGVTLSEEYSRLHSLGIPQANLEKIASRSLSC